jgi:hypothetical protein
MGAEEPLELPGLQSGYAAKVGQADRHRKPAAQIAVDVLQNWLAGATGRRGKGGRAIPAAGLFGIPVMNIRLAFHRSRLCLKWTGYGQSLLCLDDANTASIVPQITARRGGEDMRFPQSH